MNSGTFITIEGIHGAGKSIISQMLFKKLRGLKLDVILTADQAGTQLGKIIRKINLEEGYGIDTITEALLIAAARRQNIVEIIKPSLSQGKIVICERYIDAYFAFQGFARKLPMKFLEFISSNISEGIRVDLTVLLDLDSKIALARLNLDNMHRIEKEPIKFHEKVRQGYLAQARKHSNRIKIIDANAPPDEVFGRVWKIVKKFLTLRGVNTC